MVSGSKVSAEMRGMHTAINRKEGVVGFGESDLCYKNMRRGRSCHLGLVLLR